MSIEPVSRVTVLFCVQSFVFEATASWISLPGLLPLGRVVADSLP